MSVAIRLESKGLGCYSHRRVGQDGQSFAVTQFRRVIGGAHATGEELAAQNEGEGLVNITDDSRAARVGRYRRRLCIDRRSQPQLVNLLREKMSLVSAGPGVTGEDERAWAGHWGPGL